MNDVVNLRRFRKQRTREENEKQAQAQRVAFGRSKAERERSAMEAEKASRDLEGHRLNGTGNDAREPGQS